MYMMQSYRSHRHSLRGGRCRFPPGLYECGAAHRGGDHPSGGR